MPNCSIRNLYCMKSNHRTILVSILLKLNRGCRPFQCLASWMLHMEFKHLVRENLINNGEVAANLEHFQNMVQIWNKQVYSNIFSHKWRLLAELERI